MKKEKLIFFSGVISALLVILNSVGTFKLCGGVVYGSCMDIVADIMIVFLPVSSLFIFSIIVFRMREETFNAWWKLARIWIPVSMLAIIISPSYANNWMFPVEKGNVAVFLSLAFIIASTLVTTFSWQFSRKGKAFTYGYILTAAIFSLFVAMAVLISLARAL